jgi:uncharacterized protein
MRDFRDAKAMAQSLREALKAKSVAVSHSESLELIARAFGLPDWNVLAAKIQSSRPATVADATASPPASALPSQPAGAGVPVLPIRDLVLFPQMIAPIFVGREKTRRAIDRAIATDGRILVVTQRRPGDDDPALDQLYSTGVTASLLNRELLPDGTLKLFISGLQRTAVVKAVESEFLAAETAPVEETNTQTPEAIALSRAVLDAYQIYANVDFSALLPMEIQARFRLPATGAPGRLADSVALLLSIGIDKRQQILEATDVVRRLEMILELMKAGSNAA